MVVVQMGQEDLSHFVRMDTRQIDVLQRTAAHIEQELTAIDVDQRGHAGPLGRQLRSAGPDQVHVKVGRLRAADTGPQHEHECEVQRFPHCGPPRSG
jgi:hypothetical protein